MISLTHIAAEKIKKSIDARAALTLGIKVGVKDSGCSGFSYVLEFVDQPGLTDIEYKCHGISIFTTSADLVYVDGMQLDWERVGLNEGFKFNNPNAKEGCGCGKSFTVDA